MSFKTHKNDGKKKTPKLSKEILNELEILVVICIFSVSLYMMGYAKNKQEKHTLTLFTGSKDQGI